MWKVSICYALWGFFILLLFYTANSIFMIIKVIEQEWQNLLNENIWVL